MDRTTPRQRRTDLLTLRIYGDNITMYRSAWWAMLDDMRPDCDTARRIRELIEA